MRAEYEEWRDKFSAFVVHCKRDAHDVYIGRPSKWGNPHPLWREDDREYVLDRYIEWLSNQPQLIADARRELRGKVLGCWCAPRLCHGHVLAMIANSGEEAWVQPELVVEL